MIEEVCAGNAAALALVRATSDNGMAVTAACRQLELMRQSIAEETGGRHQHIAPGLVVVIQSADGTARQFPPAPPPRQIEYAPLRSE